MRIGEEDPHELTRKQMTEFTNLQETQKARHIEGKTYTRVSSRKWYEIYS
jgi:hypothetical protein